MCLPHTQDADFACRYLLELTQTMGMQQSVCAPTGANTPYMMVSVSESHLTALIRSQRRVYPTPVESGAGEGPDKSGCFAKAAIVLNHSQYWVTSAFRAAGDGLKAAHLSLVEVWFFLDASSCFWFILHVSTLVEKHRPKASRLQLSERKENKENEQKLLQLGS